MRFTESYDCVNVVFCILSPLILLPQLNYSGIQNQNLRDPVYIIY